MNFLKNWACDRLKTSKLSADNFKNTRREWVDWPEPAIRSGNTGQLSIDHNIDVQSAFSGAPKVARKSESNHWYACSADEQSLGRSVGRSRDYQIFWNG